MNHYSPKKSAIKAKKDFIDSCLTILFALFMASIVGLFIGWNLNLRETNYNLQQMNNQLMTDCFEPASLTE